jgi:hypothetical protein
MAYFTTEQLREYRSRFRFRAFANIQEHRERAEITIFLSHSHKDKEFVEGFIAFFDTLGIKIYVDWNDKEMPQVTNRETAEKIKQRIRVNTLFVIFATPNALASRWVPWEVGIADEIKGEEKILLVPVADHTGRFDGNEYLQLYRRVESAEAGGFGVFAPGQTRGSLLDSYVKNYAIRV